MPCQHGTCEDTCDNNGYKCTCYENDWELQAGHVCFGAKGNNYGSIILRSTGVLTKLRLLHTGEASLNCNMHRCSSGSKWGCCVTAGEIYIIITNKENEIIAPETMPKRYSYKLPGFDQNSAFIQFDVYNTTVKVGDELRIWHLQDIKDKSEYNNEGRSCANVYAVFCD
ncbi:uncharacterized protein LOC130647839 [Hydractinia symbiolongicarpus]|uniref:uncharacterized protein LOC130647839 n=1 Tax=Hydractinia symbiolongicarpus TaxID=13093 RepID=UPI00254D0443|nr:uncharacterized protein LOC130647839 [Hydractinia symbiolongicarpus]